MSAPAVVYLARRAMHPEPRISAPAAASTRDDVLFLDEARDRLDELLAAEVELAELRQYVESFDLGARGYFDLITENAALERRNRMLLGQLARDLGIDL